MEMQLTAAERRTEMANGNMRQRSEDKVTWDIMENLAVFGQRRDSGWTKEANIVAWNGGTPKVDIREWNPEHERMSKGVTLFEAEAEKLAKILCKRYGLGNNSGGRYESFSDEKFAVSEESGAAAENTMTEEAEEGGTS